MDYSLFIKIVLGILAISSSTLAQGDDDGGWERWKSGHHRHYGGRTDEGIRRSIYHNNDNYVKGHNSRYQRQEVSYEMDTNQFADMTDAEIKSTRLGFNPNIQLPDGVQLEPPLQDDALPGPLTAVATSIDWRTKGAVTPVKNQGQCGSCWSFSATGALEGHMFIKKGQLVSLSEQNLMDCSWDLGNGACNGGSMAMAFTSDYRKGGVNLGSAYPYKGISSKTCLFNKATATAQVLNPSYVNVQKGNETALMVAVNKGPISIAFAVVNSFYYYKSGVYSDPTCGTSLNHGMLVVGYGTDSATNKPYWIVKNSWGTSWGESGYIRVARGSNMCGIANSASYPVMA